MVKEELIKKSPIRNLENALSGGLMPGEFGVIASEKGGGKTSMLVQFGLDQLLQGNRVFHISFSQDVDFTLTWYNNMYDELAKDKNLKNAKAIKNEIIANRVVLNFNQDAIRIEQIMKTVKALSEGTKAKPHILIIDDFDFSKTDKTEITQFKKLASDLGVSIWFTAKTDAQFEGVPKTLMPLVDELEIILLLTPIGGSTIGIEAIKERANKNIPIDVKFDIKSLLLI